MSRIANQERVNGYECDRSSDGKSEYDDVLLWMYVLITYNIASLYTFDYLV